MATWAYLAKFKGYRTSPEFQFNLDGSGAITTIDWEADVPEKTSLTLQTNVSFDGGLTWEGWKYASNGGSIPDILPNTSLKNLKFKYLVTEETEDETLSPTFKNLTLALEPVLDIENKGDKTIRPELWITKVGNGDISIINTSNGNSEFKFTDLVDGETVYINGDREQIETDLALTYRYKNFNDNYLEWVFGSNVLRIVGDANISFRYQFKTSQG